MTKGQKISAVLFDFDGTLTRPDALDFSMIRQAIGCPAGVPILEFIETLSSPEKKEAAIAELARFELEAAANSEPNPGAEAIIHYLQSQKLHIGILSRNMLSAIKLALQNFKTVRESDFDLIISRDDPVNPKPSPDGVLLAARRWETNVEEILVVGDFLFDIQAGKNAGAMTVFLDNSGESGGKKQKVENWKLETRSLSIAESDETISHLDELRNIVQMGIPH
jgi:HAD superfamily hydrolase (TIGR01509 family)